MAIKESLLPEFDSEMAATRRVLERVPSDKPDWKPHPKSFSMAHLAQLLAMMPGWIANIITEPSLDIASGGGYKNQKTADLLEQFDKHVKNGRAAIEGAKDSVYDGTWALKRGEMTLMSMNKMAVVRQTISHISHHRGQMTVYLRMNDIPVPSIYGPTADERNF